MGINFCLFHTCMAKKVFDYINRFTLHHKPTSKRMPQVVNPVRTG